MVLAPPPIEYPFAQVVVMVLDVTPINEPPDANDPAENEYAVQFTATHHHVSANQIKNEKRKQY